MDIIFNKVGNAYVAEFEVVADFNLHIEGVVESDITIYQRTASAGGYSAVRGIPNIPAYGEVFDIDFSALVYPKFIKVVTYELPTVAVVTVNE